MTIIFLFAIVFVAILLLGKKTGFLADNAFAILTTLFILILFLVTLGYAYI